MVGGAIQTQCFDLLVTGVHAHSRLGSLFVNSHTQQLWLRGKGANPFAAFNRSHCLHAFLIDEAPCGKVVIFQSDLISLGQALQLQSGQRSVQGRTQQARNATSHQGAGHQAKHHGMAGDHFHDDDE